MFWCGSLIPNCSHCNFGAKTQVLKAPCAIHYGRVLTGNSSKPSTDLHAHLLSCYQWAAFVLAQETGGRISGIFIVLEKKELVSRRRSGSVRQTLPNRYFLFLDVSNCRFLSAPYLSKLFYFFTKSYLCDGAYRHGTRATVLLSFFPHHSWYQTLSLNEKKEISQQNFFFSSF